MPISDMRQAADGIDTMGEIDSNGSSDSVISFNSSFSDESLEYLSAEEKACLMYLEETIQSLDKEDDSGLSNDESVQLPARGNVANKAAHLSASIALNRLPSKDVTKRLYSSESFEQNSEILNYMVPTPFVIANRNAQIKIKPGLATSQKKTEHRLTSKPTQNDLEAPQIRSKISVVTSQKIKGGRDDVKNQLNKPWSENQAARGPLSYEALVHLRKSPSVPKPDSPANKNEESSPTKDFNGNSFQSQNAKREIKIAPPPIAPKPKINLPVHQDEASSTLPDPTMPYLGVLGADTLMNPEKVRMEALCKLGLLKRDAKISHQLKPQTSATVQNQYSNERPLSRPEDQLKRLVQMGPVHQRSVSDISTVSPSPHRGMLSTTKSATLDRTGVGISGADTRTLPMLTTNSHLKDNRMVSSDSTRSPHTKGVNVLVPSIGRDRREALRKLGLLKN